MSNGGQCVQDFCDTGEVAHMPSVSLHVGTRDIRHGTGYLQIEYIHGEKLKWTQVILKLRFRNRSYERTD